MIWVAHRRRAASGGGREEHLVSFHEVQVILRGGACKETHALSGLPLTVPVSDESHCPLTETTAARWSEVHPETREREEGGRGTGAESVCGKWDPAGT